MRWSIPVGRAFGITLRLHVTFLLLLAFIGYESFVGAGVYGAFWALTLVCAAFACIALHELGHSLVAQQLSIQVKSITLLPIGGIASLRKIPENPWHEIAITLAGPMVNAAIAALLLPVTGLPSTLFVVTMPHNFGGLLYALVNVNLGLLLFNLIPAFPMDGGRLLRAVLALVVPYRRATQVAATVGQGLAVLAVFIGFHLWPGPDALWLILIGAFIFVAAEGEDKMVRMRSVLQEIDVTDLMNRGFATLSPLDTVARGLQLFYQTGQDGFPVLNGERVIGVVTRRALVEAMNAGGKDVPIAEVMDTDVLITSPHTSVAQVYEKMLEDDYTGVPVMNESRLVGLLTRDTITRYLQVQASIKTPRRRWRTSRVAGAQTSALPPVIADVPPIAVPPPRGEPVPPTGPV